MVIQRSIYAIGVISILALILASADNHYTNAKYLAWKWGIYADYEYPPLK
jgi:hypothetical protein